MARSLEKSAQRRKTIRVSTRHVSLDVPRVRPRSGPRLPQAVTATYATPRALASPAFLADKVRSPPRTRERRLRASLSPPRVRPPISGLGSRATKSASRHFILNRRRYPPLSASPLRRPHAVAHAGLSDPSLTPWASPRESRSTTTMPSSRSARSSSKVRVPPRHAQSPREIFPLVGSRPVVPAPAAPFPRVPDRPPFLRRG